MMKNILLILFIFIFIFIFSCGDDDSIYVVIGGKTKTTTTTTIITTTTTTIRMVGMIPPPSGLKASPMNIKFTPSVVKRGDIITITYDMDKVEIGFWINTFWANNWVNYITVDSNGNLEYIGDETNYTGGMPSWNLNSIVRFNNINTRAGEYFSYPKYTSFKWGEIKCIVPDDAISAGISLYISIASNSNDRLIVVDDDGKEIW